MKNIFKLTSLLLCLLLLLTSVISCASTETQTTTDSTAETTAADTSEASDTAPVELTVEDLTEGFVDGEYTLDESPVRPHELLTALYRIAGEPEASRNFEAMLNVGEKNSYYHDATVWAAFQAGIIPFAAKTYTSANGLSLRLLTGFFIRDCTIAEVIDSLPVSEVTSIECFLNFDTDITRSDAVLAMYYYSLAYLKKDVTANDTLEAFADNKLFTEKHSERYKMYINDSSNGYPELRKDLPASWNWAIDAGIIEPYPDNTLRPDATLTRAEFAAMLTRFMDYVK